MSTDTRTPVAHTGERRTDPARTTGQAVWPIVMTREIVVKLRDRTFLVGTVVTLVILGGALGLQMFMSGRSHDVTVAVSGDGARAVMEQVGTTASQRQDNISLKISDATSAEAVTAQVRDEQANVGLVHDATGWRLLAKTAIDPTMTGYVTEAVQARTLAVNAAAAGTSVATLTAGGDVTPQVLDGESNEGLKLVVSLVFTFLFYFASITFGLAIAQSVVEEKQSRVVEILVSAVPLRQLLAGKVIGNVLLALGQMTLYIAVGLIGLAFTSYAGQIGLVAASAGWFLVFFIAGFAALACLWAVAGSLATRNEDLQATTPVLTMILVVAMFVGIMGEGVVRTVGSYVPVVSAISMPQRLLRGEAAWWEPFLSLLVTLAFAAWTMVVGERLYRRSIMHTGRRLHLREVLRAADWSR
jgi:ABC-2 type transport system permease protein